MSLVLLIIIPLISGAACLFADRAGEKLPRRIALAGTSVALLLSLFLCSTNYAPAERWLIACHQPWIPQLGVSFTLAADGLGLLMLVLTSFLGFIAVLVSTDITFRRGAYYLTLLWTIAGITGVFVALDLFLFYFFWEMMLVPMYFLIAVWGHENRYYASFKFFIFTQAFSLLLLVAILTLYFVHGRATGVYTFAYEQLLGTAMSPLTEILLMLGFFAGFAVKLPVVPLHTWLPDAHTEAPTAGSVLLAGILLKTGAYGIFRFVLPLFPHAAHAFSPIAAFLAVTGILYGALLSFAQTDLKRLVAYTSVSHLGFVLLGAFTWQTPAMQGAIMEMICHALSTGALFVVVGFIYRRAHTRDLAQLSGLWHVAPRLSGAALFFALASLGLPGLGNFVAEFLILVGSYPNLPLLTVFAALGLVGATIYSLRLVEKTVHGILRLPESVSFPDLSKQEFTVLAAMMALLVWLGTFPQAVLDTSVDTVEAILAEGAK